MRALSLLSSALAVVIELHVTLLSTFVWWLRAGWLDDGAQIASIGVVQSNVRSQHTRHLRWSGWPSPSACVMAIGTRSYCPVHSFVVVVDMRALNPAHSSLLSNWVKQLTAASLCKGFMMVLAPKIRQLMSSSQILISPVFPPRSSMGPTRLAWYLAAVDWRLLIIYLGFIWDMMGSTREEPDTYQGHLAYINWRLGGCNMNKLGWQCRALHNWYGVIVSNTNAAILDYDGQRCRKRVTPGTCF